jgi:hypothetical protein
MPTAQRTLMLALALALCGFAPANATAAQPVRIAPPKPAPPTAPNVLPLPPATIDNTLAIGGQDVKARELDTRLSVDVFVNGRGPYHFVVDSGADSSAIGLRVAHDLQLPLGTPVVLNGMTSRELVSRVKIQALTLGTTTVRDLEVPALREQDLGGDGLLGIDALVEQRLMMDFEKHVIHVEDARIPMKIEPGDIVVTAKRRRGQLILTEVRAARYSLDAVIDTGSEVTIGNLALRDKLIRNNRAKFWTVQAIGVTGVPVNLEMARVDELQLGPVILNDVPIAFADVAPFRLFGLSDRPALLLGTDLLASFRRVSLDFRARRVRFQLRRCKTVGIVINTAPVDMFTRIGTNGGADICAQ